jgi:diguanylate cyclase (GGDEF)-like protein
VSGGKWKQPEINPEDAMVFSVLYVGMYLFCMVIVGIIYTNILISGDNQLVKIWFRRANFVLFVYLLAEMIRGYLNLIGGVDQRILLVVEITYAFVLVSLVFIWAVSLWMRIRPDSTRSRMRNLLMHVPWLTLSILLFTSPWTKAFSYIRNGRMHEGQLYGLQVPVMLVAQLVLLLVALVFLRYMEASTIRIEIVVAAVYPAAAMLMKWIADFRGYDYFPAAGVVMMIGSLHLYLLELSHLVSIDPLTRTNNRNRLYNYIESKREQNVPFYLLMIDVNHFKSINNEYGHVEGDEALIRVSDALRQACQTLTGKPMIARYGGDEFVIAAELRDDSEVEELIGSIHKNLQYFNEWAGVKYALSVSVGTTKVDADTKDVKEQIRKADQSLYEQKKKTR